MAWAVLVGGLVTLFSFAEKVAKPEVKRAIANWLQNLQIGVPLSNWPAQFAAMFDGIFGEHHFSWRCFWRSCVTSILSLVVIIIILKSLRSESAHKENIGLVGAFLLWGSFNLIPDYFSLLESRYIIYWMSKKYSISRVLTLLVLDFITTIIIWHTWFSTHMIIVMSLYKKKLAPELGLFWIKSFWEALSWLFFGTINQKDTFELFATAQFYSTFFTSVWIWLYVCSGLVVKLLNKIGVGLNLFKGILNIEKHPIRSIGFFTCLIVTILFLIGVPFALS